jgi:rod shape-determining protein MreD
MGSYLTLTDRLFFAARMVLPYAVILLLLIMSVMSAPAPLSLIFKAPFFLMALYYWTIFRPSLLPVWLVFLIGLLLDILSGLPLGLNAIIFIVCRIVILDQRRFLMSQSFFMNWLGFSILNSAYQVSQWLLFSLLALRWISFQDLWPPLVLGILFFPVISVVLHLTHKILPPHISQAAGYNTQRKGIPL